MVVTISTAGPINSEVSPRQTMAMLKSRGIPGLRDNQQEARPSPTPARSPFYPESPYCPKLTPTTYGQTTAADEDLGIVDKNRYVPHSSLASPMSHRVIAASNLLIRPHMPNTRCRGHVSSVTCHIFGTSKHNVAEDAPGRIPVWSASSHACVPGSTQLTTSPGKRRAGYKWICLRPRQSGILAASRGTKRRIPISGANGQQTYPQTYHFQSLHHVSPVCEQGILSLSAPTKHPMTIPHCTYQDDVSICLHLSLQPFNRH